MNHPATPEKASFVLPPASGWHRVVRFLRRPWLHQYYSLALRVQAKFPAFHFPVRLSFGASYLVSNSEVDHRILFGDFELAETLFLKQYLEPGMKVLDIGAHHGFYSLMASLVVGEEGSVDTFEPSPREFAQLQRNVKRNRCENVRTHNVALGFQSGTATLYEASQEFDGFNSLRRQENISQATPVEVRLVSLDQLRKEGAIDIVDFIKMDVEGAELSVLQGAAELLGTVPRPIILAEVSDLRTKAWGYPAREIVRYLQGRNFEWFEPSQNGTLVKADAGLDYYNHNLVAVPVEKLRRLQSLLGGTW